MADGGNSANLYTVVAAGIAAFFSFLGGFLPWYLGSHDRRKAHGDRRELPRHPESDRRSHPIHRKPNGGEHHDRDGD